MKGAWRRAVKLKSYLNAADASEQHYITLIDALVLVHSLYRCHKRFGYEDYEVPFDNLVGALDCVGIVLPRRLLESALWAASLVAEKRTFWHPQGLTFTAFKKQLEGRFNERNLEDRHVYFDRNLNIFRPLKGEEE